MEKILVNINKLLNQIDYSKFPDDFNGENWLSNLTEEKDELLTKYRQIIYEKFKSTTFHYFEVEIDEDFDNIQYFIFKELKERHLKYEIDVRVIDTNKMDENNYEYIYIKKRYLVVEPCII